MYNNGVCQDLEWMDDPDTTISTLQLLLKHRWPFFLWYFYELFSLKNVLVEKHGLLSRIDIVLWLIHQLWKLCWTQMQMGGAYAMVQHGGLNIVSV